MTEEATTNGLDATAHEWRERRVSYPLVVTSEARTTATDFERHLRSMVHERPVVSVLTAAGLGYFFARMFARGMR